MTSHLFSGTAPLLVFVAKATLLLIAAFMATIPLRRGTAGSRHLVWLAALVGVLALPLLSRVESLRIGVLPSSLAVNDAAERADSPAPRAPTAAAIALTPMDAPRIASSAPSIRDEQSVTPVAVLAVAPTIAIASMTTLSILAFVWAVVALGLVGWLLLGTISVRRIVANARELSSPDWTMPLCEVADRLDLESPPRLVVSDRTEMAFACRALAPTIVLPAAAESWSDDRRRAVLFHELAHIKRHDLAGHALGRFACALYWFHPLVWTAAKNLRAESERACDDLVLSCGARPSEYAQHLLEMVTSVRNYGAPIMALPMARRKEFEGRMLAILDPAIRRSSPGRLQSAFVIGAIGVLSLTVAAVAPAAARARPSQSASAAIVAEIEQPSPATAPVARIASQAAVASAVAPQLPESPPTSDAAAPTNPGFAAPAAWSPPRGHQSEPDTARIAMLARILVNDPDAQVRRTAAWGLNELHAPEAQNALIRALRADTDAQVREMAAWSLAEYHGATIVAALVDGLRDKDAKVRQVSAWGLGQLGAKSSVSDLEGAITDADEQVREIAIWAIGQMDVKSASPLLVNALTDNSQRIRLIAAWAIGEIADPSTSNAISKAFETETSNEVRKAELRALSEMGKISQSVLDVTLKSTDPELRRYGVALLAGGSGADPWPWPWPWPRPSP